MKKPTPPPGRVYLEGALSKKDIYEMLLVVTGGVLYIGFLIWIR